MLQWPSLTERRAGGVHPSRLHESVFLYVLQLKRLRVRTVVSGVLLFFYFGHHVGDKPVDARRKHFRGTEKQGSILRTAALYHHNT